MALIFDCSFIDSFIHSTDFLSIHHIPDMVLTAAQEQREKVCAVTHVCKFTASKVPLLFLHCKSEAWVSTQKLGGRQEQGTEEEHSVNDDLVHHFMLAT